jgi:hypothetical protein
MNQIIKDAQRYRRLRSLGAAVHGTDQLDAGLVSRFTNLDALVDHDLATTATRGEEELTAKHDPVTVIDRKFIIAAVNPVNGKEYDETNSLLLCAKDAAVPVALRAYAAECERLGANPEHVQSIHLLLGRVEQFQANAGGGRVPDTIGEELPRCLRGKGL